MMIRKCIMRAGTFLSRAGRRLAADSDKPDEAELSRGAKMPAGLVSHLSNRRVMSLTGRDVRRIMEEVVSNNTGSFFSDEQRRAMYCLVLDHSVPADISHKIMFDFYLYRPYLEEDAKIGAEYWLDVDSRAAPSLMHYLIKRFNEHGTPDISGYDVSDTLKVYALQSYYGLHEGEEGCVYKRFQDTAPKFPADNDPTVASPLSTP